MIDSGYRLDYKACRAHLEKRLAESAPGRLQLLTGPRQVGKTTLLLQLAEQQGERGVYAACDGPEATLPGFWERIWIQSAGGRQTCGALRLVSRRLRAAGRPATVAGLHSRLHHRTGHRTRCARARRDPPAGTISPDLRAMR